MHDDAADTAADLERLARYRFEHDLTYEQLGAVMTAKGFPVKGRSLHVSLTGRLTGVPRDRTRYKIREFLATIEADERRKPKGRRKKVA